MFLPRGGSVQTAAEITVRKEMYISLMFFNFYLLQQKVVAYFSFPYVWVKSDTHIVHATLVQIFVQRTLLFPPILSGVSNKQISVDKQTF